MPAFFTASSTVSYAAGSVMISQLSPSSFRSSPPDFEDDVHQVVFLGGRLRDNDVALLVEHIGDGSGLSHIAVVLAKHVPDFADCPVAVVGRNLGQQSHSARAIAFEHEFFVG